MWLFGGAFGVGGEKRGRLRDRHENVLKKTSRYKMFRILAIFGVCGILYIGFGTVKTVPYGAEQKEQQTIKRQLLIKLLGSCLNYNLI